MTRLMCKAVGGAAYAWLWVCLAAAPVLADPSEPPAPAARAESNAEIPALVIDFEDGVVAGSETADTAAAESANGGDDAVPPEVPAAATAAGGAEPTALAGATSLEAEVAAEQLRILGTTVLPGSQARLAWSGSESFAGISVPTPVLVAHGAWRGLTLCLTAAVHGDELNGIEVVRRVYYGLRPSELRGTVIGVPIVNLPGFRRGSRYLPDRRDLNRYFPGDPGGSAAARVAYAFFEQVVLRCDALVDLHTGSLLRTNLPHVRVDLDEAGSARLARSFGGLPVLHDPPAEGTLRRAAQRAGISTVTVEAGSPSQLERREVEAGVRAVQALIARLGLTRPAQRDEPGPEYGASLWVRAESGGILLSAVRPGDTVRSGQRLGSVADPITNARVPIVAPVSGVVLGMALDQVVMPGFATHHLGLPEAEADKPESAAPFDRLPE